MRSLLDWIAFDTSDLDSQGEIDGARIWHSRTGDAVVLHGYQVPPDITVSLNDSSGLLRMFQQAVADGAGVVEARPVSLDGCPGIRTIIKAVQDRETGRGRLYIGSLILPRRTMSFVIKIQCPELEMTGMRESLVMGQLLDSGALRLTKLAEERETNDGSIRVFGPGDWDGWIADPSDPAPAHLARSVADDPNYDVILPGHPLSRLRARLLKIEQSLTVTVEVKAVPAFDPEWSRKPWWKKW